MEKWLKIKDLPWRQWLICAAVALIALLGVALPFLLNPTTQSDTADLRSRLRLVEGKLTSLEQKFLQLRTANLQASKASETSESKPPERLTALAESLELSLEQTIAAGKLLNESGKSGDQPDSKMLMELEQCARIWSILSEAQQQKYLEYLRRQGE